MKKLGVLLLWSLASCGGAEKSSEMDAARSKSARDAFETWVKAAVGGDSAMTFAMLSDGNKSGWLYERLEEGDVSARRWRGELTGTARTELDLWWGVAKQRSSGRDEPLPASVLLHPSLAQLFVEYFVRTESGIRVQMSRLQVAQTSEYRLGAGHSYSPTVRGKGPAFINDEWRNPNDERMSNA